MSDDDGHQIGQKSTAKNAQAGDGNAAKRARPLGAYLDFEPEFDSDGEYDSDEGDGDGDGEASLSDGEGFNALQPEPSLSFHYFFGFVESVEEILGHADDNSRGNTNDSEAAILVEIDCIYAEHFWNTIEANENYEAVDPTAITNGPESAEIIDRRMNLFQDLLADDAQLRTVYVYISSDHDYFDAVRDGLPIGDWIFLETRMLEDPTEYSVDDVSTFDLTNTVLYFLAENSEADRFFDIQRFSVAPITDADRADLEEVFSLNHVPDVEFPGGGGPIDPDPIPVPNINPPVVEYNSSNTLFLDYEVSIDGENWGHAEDDFHNASIANWGEDYSTLAIEVNSDVANDRWVMSVNGVTFHTAPGDNHSVWHRDDNPDLTYDLVLIHDRELGVVAPTLGFRRQGQAPPTPEQGFDPLLAAPLSPTRPRWGKVR